MLRNDIPPKLAAWTKKRVLLYSHGGLVPQDSALQYVANYLPDLLDGAGLSDRLHLAIRCLDDDLPTSCATRSPSGTTKACSTRPRTSCSTASTTPSSRSPARFGGKAMWDEMKENATLAASRADRCGAHDGDPPRARCSHPARSKRSILPATARARSCSRRLRSSSPTQKVPINSLSLWAPACTMQLFQDVYRPMIESGQHRGVRSLHPRRRHRARRRLRQHLPQVPALPGQRRVRGGGAHPDQAPERHADPGTGARCRVGYSEIVLDEAAAMDRSAGRSAFHGSSSRRFRQRRQYASDDASQDHRRRGSRAHGKQSGRIDRREGAPPPQSEHRTGERQARAGARPLAASPL